MRIIVKTIQYKDDQYLIDIKVAENRIKGRVQVIEQGDNLWIKGGHTMSTEAKPWDR